MAKDEVEASCPAGDKPFRTDVEAAVGQTVARIFQESSDSVEIVRAMKNSRTSKYLPVGLIDDDKAMKGRWIHGVKVLGAVLN